MSLLSFFFLSFNKPISGIIAGAKIVIICSISKKKLKKALFLSNIIKASPL